MAVFPASLSNEYQLSPNSRFLPLIRPVIDIRHAACASFLCGAPPAWSVQWRQTQKALEHGLVGGLQPHNGNQQLLQPPSASQWVHLSAPIAIVFNNSLSLLRPQHTHTQTPSATHTQKTLNRISVFSPGNWQLLSGQGGGCAPDLCRVLQTKAVGQRLGLGLRLELGLAPASVACCHLTLAFCMRIANWNTLCVCVSVRLCCISPFFSIFGVAHLKLGSSSFPVATAKAE